MSYIRSGSNPEGLYIWGDVHGRVYVMHNAPVSSTSREIVIPRRVFERACERWTGYSERVRHRGLVVEESWELLNGKSELLVKFSYKGAYVCMWSVTWEYIAASVQRRLREASKRRRIS